MKILVTGASGFIGQSFCKRALELSFNLRGTIFSKNPPSVSLEGVERVNVKSIGPNTKWGDALKDVDTVVHLAARVHSKNTVERDTIADFMSVNTYGTLNLAFQSATSNVRRFIFISSIKVNGEGRDLPYTERDNPIPKSIYGISKWEAEQSLAEISQKTKLEIVILRLPLVYGPGVKANFLNLFDKVKNGTLLPLGGINNKRSFLFVDNVVDAIITCLNHPMAVNQTFLVSDGEDVSTTDLVKRIAASINQTARLFSLPTSLLRIAGKVIGKSGEVDSLLNNLVVDCSKIHNKLGWVPPYTMEDGLRKTAEWYKTRN